MRNFEVVVDELVAGVEPEDYEFNKTAKSLATIALQDVELKYGENSENPLEQHNAEHAVDVARRAIELTNLVYKYIPEEYKENIYELVLLVGLTHDYEQLMGSGENERLSAEYLINLIEQTNDPQLNNKRFKERAKNGVLVTEIEEIIDKKDELIINQPRLEEGEPDPLKFIVGFADINGIAMEGKKRMWRDVAGLFLEGSRGKKPKKADLKNLIDYQSKFIRSQLNDYRMKPRIARYFPHLQPKSSEKENPVFTEMYNAYNPTIIEAHDVAEMFRKSSTELLEGAETVISKIDVLGLADKLAKTVKLPKK